MRGRCPEPEHGETTMELTKRLGKTFLGGSWHCCLVSRLLKSGDSEVGIKHTSKPTRNFRTPFPRLALKMLCGTAAVVVALAVAGMTATSAHAAQITLQNATATRSQGGNFVVGNAIDSPANVGPGPILGGPQPTGWAILSDANQNSTSAISETAVFETDPTDPDLVFSTATTLLTFTLDFQYEDTFWGVDSAKFNLGRFRLSATTDGRATFADGLANGGDVTANWIVLDPTSVFSTDATTSFTELGDNSLLANAASANIKQTYTVTAETTLSNITGIRLEALEDNSLTLNGPGRFPVDGNFVLTTFSLDASPITEADVTVTDGCDVGGGANDIDTLTASFDATADEITVVMVLCDDADDKTKYRVHFDHTVPFFDDDDRNGDLVVDGLDFCFTTSDDTMKHRGDRDTGPGLIEVDGNTLTYTVPVDDLDPLLDLGDTLYIWANTQFKGINDRAPNTESGDGCSKPEVETEVLALTLEPPFKTVFVTSTSHNGNLGGLAGADGFCQTRAEAAGLGGTYKAWLADDTGSPATRFVQATVPYVRTDGVKVADDWNDLLDCSNPTCLQAPINRDEHANELNRFVWTNVRPNGTVNSSDNRHHCSRWSVTGTGIWGLTSGLGPRVDTDWTLFGAGVGCSFSSGLYCFEQ